MAKDMYQKRRERKEAKVNNDESLHKTSINWYPGHMAKTKREIIEDLKLIDVVIELLDSRIPLASQNPEIKSIIGNKKRIIALNKCDLSDNIENRKWLQYFKDKNLPAVLLDSNSGEGINNMIKEIEALMSDTLKIQEDKGRVGRAIRVLVLGIPNVGKSSFINRIAKRTTAIVGNKPGVTKQKQWVRVTNNIELLDTPGVLWPKLENQKVALNLAYVGTIKDDILQKIEIAYYLFKFLLENYKKNLLERYDLSEETVDSVMNNSEQAENDNIYELMCLAGKNRGALVSGGKVDEEKIANMILKDFRSGKLGKITLEKVGNIFGK